MYELTGSAWYLGLVGLAQFLPLFILTLVVGQVADRYDRRLIACLCQAVQGLAACALAVASFGNWQSKESILAIVLAAGVARAFEMPTMQALLPGLVPAPFIPRAVTGSASALQTASIVGPALGGLLYAIGTGTVYLTSGVLFCAASVFVYLIRIPRAASRREPVTLRSVFAGIDYIRSRPEILGAISLDLFAVLLGGATALLPIYAKGILFDGTLGIGSSALGPGRRGAGDVGGPDPLPPSTPRGKDHARRRGHLQYGYDRVCAVDIVFPIPLLAGDSGGSRYDQRRYPAISGSDQDAG